MKTWDKPEVKAVEIRETAWGAYPLGKADANVYVNSIEALNQQLRLKKTPDGDPPTEDLFSGE